MAAKLAGETGDRFGTAGERWPSLAYLINTKDRTTCTASIIGPRWVVVAHSCITKRYVLLVLLKKNRNGNNVFVIDTYYLLIIS